MKIKKYVMEIVGKAVQDHGFFYDKDESDRISWIFKKSESQVHQIILIQKHRFSNELLLRFQTTAYGMPQVDATKIIPHHKYHNGIMGFMYEDEESLQMILREFIDIIENYGLTKLAELSIEDEVIPTIEMKNRLFELHDILCQKFILKNEIAIGDRSETDIRKWFAIIIKLMQETKNRSYEDVKERLLEVAAFLGNQLVIGLGGSWYQAAQEAKTVLINELNCHNIISYSVLNIVIKTWENQKFKVFEEEYLWLFKAKPPLEREQMIKLSNELMEIYKNDI